MTAASKAAIMLALTFLLGGLVGALGYGAVMNERQHDRQREPNGPPPGLGGPPDGRGRAGGPGPFVVQTLDLIGPRDAAQANALRPFLEETDRHNRLIVDSARARMHAELAVLREHIAPLLDADQRQRFDDFARR